MAYLSAGLPSLLRGAGLTVKALPGWATRGRPASTGGFDPVGVLWHHTADKADGIEYARWLGEVGRADLPAPLCQLSIGRDGTVYVLAAGRANHAGKARESGPIGAGDGNSMYVGIEFMNDGTESFTAAQYAAGITTTVVLLRLLGTSSEYVRGHKETSTSGKVDPRLNMNTVRTDVGEAMKPNTKKTRGKRVDTSIKKLRKARKKAVKGGKKVRARRLKKALQWLRKIKPRKAKK